MPASHERIPNRPLSGSDLREIIKKDVDNILSKEGMLTSNIAYNRVAYEVRVTMHLEIQGMPEHISTVLSRPASKQQIGADPSLAAIEAPPLANTSEDSVVSSTETHREIKSPNLARVENDMSIPLGKIDEETGKEKTITYTGDKPDPASGGNKVVTTDVSEEQEVKWKGESGRRRK